MRHGQFPGEEMLENTSQILGVAFSGSALEKRQNIFVAARGDTIISVLNSLDDRAKFVGRFKSKLLMERQAMLVSWLSIKSLLLEPF